MIEVRKIKRIFFVLFGIFIFRTSVFANVSFDDLDLNAQDNLLYSVKHEIPGTPSYKTLYLTKLNETKSSSSQEILTCFPEQMELLDEGKKLQIRNRYGTAIYSTQSSRLDWISSANKIPIEYTHTGIYSVSKNGKWAVYVKQSTSSLGQLVLLNCSTFEEKVLVESSPFSYDKINVKWSPSSNSLIYEKNSNLYFTTPEVAFKNIQIPEEYRKIGKGTINSVAWTDSGNLIYISGDIIYKISEKEFFTRGLYSSLVGNGEIIGRLTSSFDNLHNVFFVDSDASKIVVISEEKSLSYYSLGLNSYDYVKLLEYYPLTLIKGSPLSYKIFWTGDGNPVLWIDFLDFNSVQKTSTVYAIQDSALKSILAVKNSLEPKLSPDKRYIAFTGGSSIFVYDTTTWKPVSKLSGEKIYSFVWASSSLLYVGGEYSVRLWKLDSSSMASSALSSTNQTLEDVSQGFSLTLFLSAPYKNFWDEEKIICQNGNDKKFYQYDFSSNLWLETKNYSEYKNSEKNGSFRVFLGTSVNPKFKNEIFVRSLSGKVLTYSVHPESEIKIPKSKRIAFAIDAVDSSEGLAQVLSVLNSFNVNATFFINGEFIRRYPVETRQILSSGYECASSFYSSANLLQNNFVIDDDFIKRGLARNEDEFFATTGKELSLLWHAPYYVSNSAMKKAGESAGYKYVDAFTKFNDRVTLEEQEKSQSKIYFSSSELIEKYLENLYDGMIIPITLGNSSGSRFDYLYENFDLLISAILDNDGEIVDLREFF